MPHSVLVTENKMRKVLRQLRTEPALPLAIIYAFCEFDEESEIWVPMSTPRATALLFDALEDSAG